MSKSDLLYIKSALLHHPRRRDNIIFNLSHNAISKVFRKAKGKFEIDNEVTTYSLRHTHASYLLSKGIPIEYISKRLGHSNIGITLDVYTHLLDEHKKNKVHVSENYFLDTYLTRDVLNHCYIKVVIWTPRTLIDFITVYEVRHRGLLLCLIFIKVFI